MSIKIIRLPRKKIHTPAFTDGAVIFICEEANNKEYILLKKHESAHILLNHFLRSPIEDVKNINRKNWEMAREIEIARNLYDDSDESLLKDKFSILHGGVGKNSIPELPPELLLAEEIYHWLCANKNEEEHSCCATLKISDDEDKYEDKIVLSEDEIRVLIEECKKAIQDYTYEIETIKTKKIPTLASEIDYILRRKNLIKKTYLYPSRRESKIFILKGRRKIKKSPLVEIFVDRSGSFTPEKTKESLDVINIILRKYKTKIKSDFFYFSDGKLYDHDIPPDGCTPYHLVMNHIEKSHPKIAIIITDDDLEEGLKPISNSETKILCVAIGCDSTKISSIINAKEVILNIK